MAALTHGPELVLHAHHDREQLVSVNQREGTHLEGKNDLIDLLPRLIFSLLIRLKWEDPRSIPVEDLLLLETIERFLDEFKLGYGYTE